MRRHPGRHARPPKHSARQPRGLKHRSPGSPHHGRPHRRRLSQEHPGQMAMHWGPVRRRGRNHRRRQPGQASPGCSPARACRYPAGRCRRPQVVMGKLQLLVWPLAGRSLQVFHLQSVPLHQKLPGTRRSRHRPFYRRQIDRLRHAGRSKPLLNPSFSCVFLSCQDTSLHHRRWGLFQNTPPCSPPPNRRALKIPAR